MNGGFPGMGLEYLRAVDVTFAIIARTPELFPRLQKGIRRARLRRFPYGVFFIERSGTISVLAVMLRTEIRGAGYRAPSAAVPTSNRIQHIGLEPE